MASIADMPEKFASTVNKPESGTYRRLLDLAWLAGIIEGEGCLSPCGPNSWRVGVKMTDEDVVRRVADVAGVGRVAGPYEPRNGNKPQWTWTVSKSSDVVGLLATLWPFFGERRRERAGEILRWWRDQYDPDPRCKNGHRKAEHRRADGRCQVCRDDAAVRAAQRRKAGV